MQIPPYTGNYERLLFDSGFPRWMLNTLIVATTVTRSSSSSTRWPATRWPSWSSPASASSSCYAHPADGALSALLIPLWSIAHSLHITNTYLALILPPLANPLGVFLMRQFILGLPKDLENAARLEG